VRLSLALVGGGCAAAVRATPLMQWAREVKAGRNAKWLCVREACSIAARGGDLQVLKWLHRTGCHWDSATCGRAVQVDTGSTPFRPRVDRTWFQHLKLDRDKPLLRCAFKLRRYSAAPPPGPGTWRC
jgi:hypothetical protein